VGTPQADDAAIGKLELSAARSWRAPDEERLGDWLLRAAGGFTGRANSALAIGDPGVPLARAVERVRAWYASRGLPPMIAISYPMAGPDGSEVDWYLADQGWLLRGAPAAVMTADPAAIASLTGPAVSVRLDDAPGDDWMAMYHYRGTELPPIARQVLTSAPWQAFGSIREAGQIIAIGRVAAASGWAGLTAIETDPRHRRRGLATAVTAALAAAAEDRGVTRLFLQVESGNSAARALYSRLGFTDHHYYHYRLAPARTS
jgi:N-acetylglutamate synthase